MAKELFNYNRSHLVAGKVRNVSQIKRIERITFYLLLFMWTMIHPPETQKKAVFYMVVRLVDIIYD